MFIITDDHLDDELTGAIRHQATAPGEVAVPFRMYDDDGILYFEGQILTDEDHIEPGDDSDCPHYSAFLWGLHNFGATDYQVLHAGRWISIY